MTAFHNSIIWPYPPPQRTAIPPQSRLLAAPFNMNRPASVSQCLHSPRHYGNKQNSRVVKTINIFPERFF